MLNEKIKNDFLGILSEELIPAMGCTEPIALAFAAAKARSVLGCDPDRIVAKCSGNIIKNVRCVRIPNSDGMTGIEAACVLGALAGDCSRDMEVLEAVTEEGLAKTVRFLRKNPCKVEYLESKIPLHFIIELYSGDETVSVEVRYSHINIVHITKNGESVYKIEDNRDLPPAADRSELSIDNIYDFAENIDISDIAPYAEKQIECNMAIAERGMKGDFGVGIGKTILDVYADSIFTRIRALSAAASEARMDGCDMPVIIVSGSGNQGIASTVPVIVYAREKGIDKEKMYRALAFSALMTVYQKEFIGKLSAFCGAVSAACSAGSAITYMLGGTLTQIKDTVDNTLADIPGIICDGAKASCAVKISSALDAALFAHSLAMRGKVYESNTGIIQSDTGDTISCVGHIGRVGMQPTDQEIVKMMIES
ncbi:MAG: serine dehydratase subunit alpha family protein [Clostridia bacterium]|nr:serine dehydratase subunit alpha family protein [Clostridia bacterium]